MICFWQKGAPVDKLQQAGRFGVVVGVGHHGSEKGLVAGEVLTPETHHEGAGQNGHVLILLIGRRVKVQSLQHGVDECLGLQLNLLSRFF